MRLRLGALLVVVLLALPHVARAQSVDPEVRSINDDFRYGKYAAVLTRVKERINRGQLSEEELVELHSAAGLSAHYLGRTADAEQHLTSLLRINPDYSLDPFVIPGSAVNFFERIRKEMTPELNVIRQKKQLEAEYRRREREDQERARRAAEEQRRRIEDLSQRITLRTVERRSFVVNFLPFGAGQFQQGRNNIGLALAVTEGATAAVSVVAYAAIALLADNVKRVLPGFDTPDGNATFTETGILKQYQGQLLAWRATKYISAGLFYLLYGLGVADALFHHEDEVITTTVIDAPPTAPQPKPSGLAPQNTLRPDLYALPGGAGAGFTFQF